MKDLLRHEAGLDKFSKMVDLRKTNRAGIRSNYLGKIIEKEPSINYKQYNRVYHTMTKDWVTNEVFRRVHPNSLTMGEHCE